MIEHKRSPFADRGRLTSLIWKSHKGGLTISNKVRKEKEKVVALQQLVSPFGKTDTASVLLESTEYIQFLHEQVKVLSSAYLQATPAVQGSAPYSLTNRGLCLVPVSCTAGLASANGSDLWAPIKTTSPRLKKSGSDFR